MGDPERRARDPQMQVHAYGARGSVFRTRTYNPVAGHIGHPTSIDPFSL